MQHDFSLLPDLIEAKGIEYATSKSTFEYFDELKKTVLGGLMNKLEGSEASRERQARTSPEYERHLQVMRDARHKMLTHEAEYKSLNLEFDMHRTVQANSRNQRY